MWIQKSIAIFMRIIHFSDINISIEVDMSTEVSRANEIPFLVVFYRTLR